MANVIEISRSVADYLHDFGAVFSTIPEFNLRQLAHRRIVVVPLNTSYKSISRGGIEEECKVSVGVLKRITEDELEKMISFVSYLATYLLGSTHCGSKCVFAEYDPLYYPDHLRENRQFTSIITLTFKAGKNEVKDRNGQSTALNKSQKGIR
jgi:hypothetical protein